MSTGHRFLSPAPQFEPPANDTHTSVRRRTPSPALSSTSQLSPHSGRSPRRSTLHDHPALHTEEVTPEARRFAELALRLTLEVMDRRRVPAQLRAVAVPAVVDVIHSIVRSTGHAGRRLGTATLERVRVRSVRSDAAEVFGTYTRGDRVFAIAARIESGNGARSPGWAITSLRIA
ncbi:hypothetical protein EGT50_01130 [Rhodococcus xishaensis]|uniref:Alanine, arginine and proline rich protein n=2 Tax=Rhodococcus xishaensis TaxID=2487364 RepID=A0A438B477_9NOCA|nr:hypothetical protein EGT50_01130 [Rhodococcus xishaensis]